MTVGLGLLAGVRHRPFSGVGALWDCVPRVFGGGGGCAGGGVPLEAVLTLSWCGEVSLGGILIISSGGCGDGGVGSIAGPPASMILNTAGSRAVCNAVTTLGGPRWYDA